MIRLDIFIILFYSILPSILMRLFKHAITFVSHTMAPKTLNRPYKLHKMQMSDKCKFKTVFYIHNAVLMLFVGDC